MMGLQYSPLHVTELCGEMQGKFIVSRARLIKYHSVNKVNRSLFSHGLGCVFQIKLQIFI